MCRARESVALFEAEARIRGLAKFVARERRTPTRSRRRGGPLSTDAARATASASPLLRPRESRRGRAAASASCASASGPGTLKPLGRVAQRDDRPAQGTGVRPSRWPRSSRAPDRAGVTAHPPRPSVGPCSRSSSGSPRASAVHDPDLLLASTSGRRLSSAARSPRSGSRSGAHHPPRGTDEYARASFRRHVFWKRCHASLTSSKRRCASIIGGSRRPPPRHARLMDRR